MKQNSTRSALAYHTLAKEFMDACKALENRTEAQQTIILPEFPHVQYYLATHSLELFLKTQLKIDGLTDQEIKKKYSHDLKKILRDVNITFNEQELEIINMIAPFYKGKELEYAKNGFKTFPNLSYIVEIIERLQKELRQPAFEHYKSQKNTDK